MTIFYLFSVITGLSGIVAQVLLARELLIGFHGNELTIGIMFAHWVLPQALGVFVFGKIIEKIKRIECIFVVLQIVFVCLFPLCIYFARTYKYFLRIPFGESLDLQVIFWAAFFINAPMSFCHGALVSVLSKMHSKITQSTNASLGIVYAWVTVGTILGGVALTFFLLSRFPTFQIAYFVCAGIVFVLWVYFKKIGFKKHTYLMIVSLIVFCALWYSFPASKLSKESLKRQWAGATLVDYRNSVYGNIAVTRQNEQTTFFYNGLPLLYAPYPDTLFLEGFVHIPLLLHHSPRDLLIVGAGAGGVLHEIEKHSLNSITYLELDPLIIEMLKEHPTPLISQELKDNRLKVVHQDGRLFLKQAAMNYDIILMGLTKPTDLSSNRYFTEEFFALTKKRINPQGVLAFSLPASLTYISTEVRDMGYSILNGLKKHFQYTRIIPFEGTMLVCASDSESMLSVSEEVISARIQERGIQVVTLLPEYLTYIFDRERLEWFQGTTKNATSSINSDTHPFALYMMELIWNRQFSKGNVFLKSFSGFRLRWLVYGLLFLLLSLSVIFLRRKKSAGTISLFFALLTTGFFSMLFNLILIFCFQISYGYVYQLLGLLVTMLMAGSAVGSIMMIALRWKIKKPLLVLLGIEAGILFFVYFSIVSFLRIGLQSVPGIWYIVLSFFAGFFMGAEFSLAGTILGSSIKVGDASGILYGADLLGGWLAGMLGGVIFLPILGLFNTCMTIVFLKITSICLISVLLMTHRKTQNR